jgi:hypothetical protein
MCDGKSRSLANLGLESMANQRDAFVASAPLTRASPGSVLATATA